MKSLRPFLPYFRYLKPVRLQFGLGVLFGVLYSFSSGFGLPLMAETVFPILFGDAESAHPFLRELVERWFADDVRGGFLILCCLSIPAMMSMRALGAFGNGYFMTYSGVAVVQAIQEDMFNKLQSMPLAFFMRYKTGELIAAVMGYPTQIKKVVVDYSNDLVKQPLTFISAGGYLVWKSITSESFFIAIIGLISVSIVVFPIRKIGTYLAKRSKQLVGLGESLNSSTIESVQSPLEIRAYNLEAEQSQRFAEKLRQIFKLTMKSVRSRLMITPSIEAISAVGFALALFLGVRSGMNQGEFVALAIALYMAYEPIKKLAKIHGSLRTLEAPLQRLEAILHAPDEIPDVPNPRALPELVRGEVTFEDVDFSYDNDKPVLRGINVTIAAGENVGLVGQSGAGKSTFVNLIPRFFEPTSGRILIDGIDLRELKKSDLRDQIAYVPQMPMLFNASIADNIRVGKSDASSDEIREAAINANALEFIESLEQGFDTVLSERGSSLSGGQRQRVAIARAFLKNAPILVMDEATSALDNESDQLIQSALRKLSRGRTTIIIAHRMGTLKDVQRRLFFKNGVLVGDGTHEELLSSTLEYKDLVNAEQGGQCRVSSPPD